MNDRPIPAHIQARVDAINERAQKTADAVKANAAARISAIEEGTESSPIDFANYRAKANELVNKYIKGLMPSEEFNYEADKLTDDFVDVDPRVQLAAANLAMEGIPTDLVVDLSTQKAMVSKPSKKDRKIIKLLNKVEKLETSVDELSAMLNDKENELEAHTYIKLGALETISSFQIKIRDLTRSGLVLRNIKVKLEAECKELSNMVQERDQRIYSLDSQVVELSSTIEKLNEVNSNLISELEMRSLRVDMQTWDA